MDRLPKYYAFGIEIPITYDGNYKDCIVKLNDNTTLICLNNYYPKNILIHNGNCIETTEVYLLYHFGKYYTVNMEEIPVQYGLFSGLDYDDIIFGEHVFCGNEAYHDVYERGRGIHMLNYSTTKFLWGKNSCKDSVLLILKHHL
jgi:hypothetical protein